MGVRGRPGRPRALFVMNTIITSLTTPIVCTIISLPPPHRGGVTSEMKDARETVMTEHEHETAHQAPGEHASHARGADTATPSAGAHGEHGPALAHTPHDRAAHAGHSEAMFKR